MGKRIWLPDSGMSVWFCTPAFRRYDVSEVCFRHRAWCIQELRRQGVDAQCVVVADDENLDIARSFGFETVEHGYDGYHDSRGKQFLGRKFNDAYEHAAQNGANYVVPIGSDSWIHPMFFAELPHRRQVMTSRFYAIVDETGSRLARLEIPVAGGVGPNVIPTPLMARKKYRPVIDRLHRGCDTSLMRSIDNRQLELKWADMHPLQYFAFRIEGEQLNPYERLASKYAKAQARNPWGRLAKIHPSDIVEQGRRIYETVAVA